jgi:hypothetical protein
MSRRARVWLLLSGIFVTATIGIITALRMGASPSVILPGGTKVVYLNGSRGVPTPGKPGLYQHQPIEHGTWVRDAWGSLRGHMPFRVQSWLPPWESEFAGFPNWPDSDELELRFQVLGAFDQNQWAIYIADENGWETAVSNYMATPAYWTAGMVRSMAKAASLGWLKVGGAFPRHCKKIKVCFHPKAPSGKGGSKEDAGTAKGEIVLDNPFYEEPAPSPGPKPPLTKPFRYGEFTLEKLTRGPLVSQQVLALRATFSLRRGPKLLDGFEIGRFQVSDSSGQRFQQTTGAGDGSTLSTSTAPWSDDLCWTVRFEIRRDNYFSDVSKNEKFVFDHLPVPSGAGVDVNRTITKNGTSLTISKIRLGTYGDWRFYVEGGYPPGKKGERGLMIQDARDNQGRTRAVHPRGGNSRLVSGPVGGSALGPEYTVHLASDAKWWDLTLVPEASETVEFKVQPEFVR